MVSNVAFIRSAHTGKRYGVSTVKRKKLHIRMTGNDYKALRESMGMTQQALADRLKMTRRGIALREKARTVGPESELAIKSLAEAHAFETESKGGAAK